MTQHHDNLNSTEITERLNKSGVRTTPVRQLVYEALAEAEEALTLADLEERLETVDKSSISRSLHLFLDRTVIHRIDDGSGASKYAISPTSHIDCNVHFYCNHCKRTLCLDNVGIPHVNLPNGFEEDSYSLIIKGICPDCTEDCSKEES